MPSLASSLLLPPWLLILPLLHQPPGSSHKTPGLLLLQVWGFGAPSAWNTHPIGNRMAPSFTTSKSLLRYHFETYSDQITLFKTGEGYGS